MYVKKRDRTSSTAMCTADVINAAAIPNSSASPSPKLARVTSILAMYRIGLILPDYV